MRFSLPSTSIVDVAPVVTCLVAKITAIVDAKSGVDAENEFSERKCGAFS